VCVADIAHRPNFEDGRKETMIGVSSAAFISMVLMIYVHRCTLRCLLLNVGLCACVSSEVVVDVGAHYSSS
jgi:hypothetical protein